MASGKKQNQIWVADRSTSCIDGKSSRIISRQALSSYWFRKASNKGSPPPVAVADSLICFSELKAMILAAMPESRTCPSELEVEVGVIKCGTSIANSPLISADFVSLICADQLGSASRRQRKSAVNSPPMPQFHSTPQRASQVGARPSARPLFESARELRDKRPHKAIASLQPIGAPRVSCPIHPGTFVCLA